MKRRLDDLWAETETPRTCCRAARIPKRVEGPAQHAAVATVPCFLTEVRNAGMSLLIPVEGDGIGRRDREEEGEREREGEILTSSITLHGGSAFLNPGPDLHTTLSYTAVFMDCSPPSANR
ncbi:hypothetical protein VZT92_001246 [Zoarces viviparus]|uniref:Uncharacterized protein n=1 Tax=Zoarces viviparus TaxID=48416 RepID=A0AAW1G348_ZOAVI